MSDIDLAARIRNLANGEVAAQEAKSLIAAYVASSPETAARKVYPAMLEVAWRLSRANSAPEDMDEWLDVFRFCEHLLDTETAPEFPGQVSPLK